MAIEIIEAFPATPSIQPPCAVSRQLRLLIVEDNMDTAVSFQRLLEIAGHEVHIVHDGIQALELAASCTPDVAFIDIGLPGLDGYQLARRLRETPTFAAATLVALSGYGRDEDKRRAAEAGFDRHFTKPVDVETVDALLAGVSALGLRSAATGAERTALLSECRRSDEAGDKKGTDRQRLHE